jgi:hypothetical protein
MSTIQYSTEAWDAPGLVYTTVLYRDLCCSRTCLYSVLHRGLSCSWTCLCYSTMLRPVLHPDMPTHRGLSFIWTYRIANVLLSM